MSEADEDRLTRLKAGKVLLERLPVELMRAGSFEHPLSLLLIRVEVAPTLRAVAFYPLLKAVARKVRDNTRAIDLSARVGDDVVLMLAETPAAGARRLGEKLTEIVDHAEYDVGLDSSEVHPQLRFATASFPEDGATPEALLACVLARADAN